jgi:hypothetical protein
MLIAKVSSCSAEAIPHEPAWVEHNMCQVCDTKFGMSTRKHHWFGGGIGNSSFLKPFFAQPALRPSAV